ncbi:MAG: phosphate acyltransferase PlsX [Culicoidibacterales bacterium]
MYTIAVDVMGSDDAPNSEMLGIQIALEKLTKINIVAFGLKEAIDKFDFKHERLSYVYTEAAIKGTDNAATAYRTKKNTSMIQAIAAVKDGRCDAVVSSGNTGAYITSALFMLGRISGVKRPALATLFPSSVKGQFFVFGDLGAVVDPTPEILEQTAVIESEIAKIMLNVKNPRIGLLNIGEEEKKGTQLYIDTHKLLKDNQTINFVGNIEPRYIMDGHADAIVADGFSGNIALKSYEGMQKVISQVLKQEIMKNFSTKMGGLLIKPALKELKATLDYESIGGAVLAGIKSPVVKAHGSTNVAQFSSAIRMAVVFLEKDLVGNINEALVTQLPNQGDDK